jgi:chemotaxis signal transduction protein
VFQVGGGRYAIASSSIVEAVPDTRLVRTPSHAESVIGMLPIEGRAVPVLCARKLFGAESAARASDGVVLLLRRHGGGCFGLRVDDVLTVIEVPPAALHPVPGGMAAFAPWVGGMIDCRASNGSEQEAVLLQLVEAQRLAERLRREPDVLLA